MLLKIVGHVYKLSRPRIMVTTLVGSQKTHNNSETHVLHTHTHARALEPDREAFGDNSY